MANLKKLKKMKPDTEKRIYRLLFLAPLLIGALLFSAFQVQGQRDKENLIRMIEEDRSTIDAIAGSDEEVQEEILQLAQTPEVLNIIEELQNKSQKRFRNIISEYDRSGQEALYEMARYPGLISELVRNGNPSSNEVNRIVSQYPSDIHETTKKYARRYYSSLREIDQLNNEIDRDFQSYLAPYDEQTHASVNVLLKHPEIVSIMVEDKEFTRLLGNAYREDPDWVIDQLDTISRELDEQNQKDLAEYQNQIQNDPEAYQEMLQAADRFSNESNITRDYVSDYNPRIEININSYPFWYGYPYWYPYPYWRPYPSYYHTGFYIGPRRNIIFIGLPSSHFIYWHTHYHPTLFPHLSYNYYNYYQRHYLPSRNHVHRPVSHYSFYRSIERNVINNPRVNNDNLSRIDRKRGNNIVRKPDIRQSSDYSRRSSSVRSDGDSRRNVLRPNSSVKRDAFPKSSPSPVRVRPSDGSRQGTARVGANSTENRSVRSGTQRTERPSGGSVRTESLGTRPTVIRGENSSTQQRNSSVGQRQETTKRPSLSEGAVRKSATIPQRSNNSQANPQPNRNYRNYKATESQQVRPSSSQNRSGGSSPQRVSPQPNRQSASPAPVNRSSSPANRTSSNRPSRNSREK